MFGICFRNTEECRTTSLMFQPLSSDPSPEHAVELEVIRMSTNGERDFSDPFKMIFKFSLLVKCSLLY